MKKNRKENHQPTTRCKKPPIAILGYFMDLPCMSDMSGDDLVRIIENKEVIAQDYLEDQVLEPREYAEDGNPWMFQHRRGHKYVQNAGVDFALLQITEKEIKFMSEIQMMALKAVWKGLESSGIPISLLHKTRTGVFVAAYERFGGFRSYPDETALRGGIMSGISDRIAYFLGIHGPTLTVETACSSSLVAMTLAVDSIRNGSCDVAILVSANIFSIEYELALQATGVISMRGECMPFDEDASGTLRCEGFGCLVLCSMDWAKNNGYCDTIKGAIVNSTIGSAGADPKATRGSGRVYESPNVVGMAEMIRLCHEQVGLPLEKVQYVEAHATGTKVGDLVELEALRDVYRDSHDIHRNPLRVGSIKGNIGHAELAAGMFSMIKVIEMIRKRTFLPTGGRSITPRTDFDWEGSNIKLCQDSEAFPPKNEEIFIGVNSFGVGGSYAHAVVTEYTGGESMKVNEVHASICPLLFTVSAASIRHLEQYEKHLLEYLRANSGDVNLLDMCGLFAINRSKLPFQRSYLSDSIKDLTDQLASDSKGKVSEGSQDNQVVAMVFTGQGSQWLSMGSGLMVFKAYKDVVTRFDALYRKLSGWSPLDMLTSLQDEHLADTMYAQPLTFMVQIGLIELLQYFGVTANVVIGHSAGEIAALYCCGLLSLEDSAKVVYHRSHCQQALAGNGRMLAVKIGSDEAKAILMDSSFRLDSCEIACSNSPSSVVIAGPQSELEILRELLASKQVKSTFLKGNTAFHSSLMDPILMDVDQKLEFLNRYKARRSRTPFLSTVTAIPQSTLSSEYIVHNIRQPVRFHETVQYLLNHFDPDVIVEIGPHGTLAPLLIECIQAANQHAQVFMSLSRGANDVQSFWHLIMKLMNNNVSVDLRCLYRDLGYRFSHIAGKNIPGHPVIPQKYSQWLFPKVKTTEGKRDIGPASGTLDSEGTKLVSVVEVSRATSAAMADHVMGDIAILPGMYFVEAAIETWGLSHGDCLSISDVTFHEMCPIPDRSKNQDPRKLFVKHSVEKTKGLTHFTVESRPLLSSDVTVHCTGTMVSFPRPDAFDGSQYIPEIKGQMEKRRATKDIGQKGIVNLLESHQSLYPMGQIYDVINQAGITEYGPSFRVIDEVRVSVDGSSFVATMEFDHEQWMSKGGIYGVQLLDGILQLGFLNPNIPSGNVIYAGGFDLGIFVRKPLENPCIVHFQFIEDDGLLGQTIINGDALVYDPTGLLLCHLIGIKCIVGKRMTSTFDAALVWQPMSIPSSSVDTKSFCPENQESGAYDPHGVAAIIGDLLKRKKVLVQGGASHVRILEYWEDSSSLPTVFENLANVDERVLPTHFNFLIEVFIATHDENVLKKGYHIYPKHKRWLRVRLLSLPSGQETLDHCCFDVIAAWKLGSGEDRWENPMDFINIAGRLGYHGCVLLHNFDVGHMWDGYVHNACDYGNGFSSCNLLSRALLDLRPDQKSIFVISKDLDISSQFREAVDLLASPSTAPITFKDRPIGRGDHQSISQLATEISGEPGENHVVIFDGILDESEYAQETFTLVARIGNELGVRNCACHVWVITSNAFVPPINVHRGSLLPLVNGMNATFMNLAAKFVDVAGPYDSLAALILSKPGPHQFMIDVDGVVHQRILLPSDTEHPPNRLLVRSEESEMCYKCDMVKPNRSNRAGNYDFFAHEVMPPGTGEVLIDIKYASLNFRDIMLTLNALPRSSFEASYYGYNLGMEASGTVIDVGAGVGHLAPGDTVAVSGKGTLASKMVVSVDDVIRFESTKIPMKDAACLSSVYITAYHALIDLCNLKKGERVLIHAAAGGVGHAAVSICSYIGAEVYATSSHAKREYCVDALGVPESRVFNSRDVSWFGDLMRATNDEGVDIVLNSLAGEHQRLGIQCLRPGGRFCEIGKADIFNNESLFLFAFRKNICLFAIDMDRMAMDASADVRKLTEKVFDGVARGDFKCLPATCFPMDKIKDAIEFMKSGAHVGKVVLSNYSEEQPLAISSKMIVQFGNEPFHLILGGAGGFGYKMIRWLYKKGARKFVTTVSNDPSRVTKMYEDLIADGAIFKVIEADLSNKKDLESIERSITSHPIHGHVETMVHCAGIYEAFYFENVPDDVLKRQGDIKVQSALFMDQLARKLESVKYFIIVGSNSSEITTPYFATYAASNAMLGSVARKRLSEGLPATILHMGSLKDVGIVAKNHSSLDYQKKSGVELINSARAVMAFETMLSDDIKEMVHTFYMPPLFAKTLGTGWIGAHMTPVVDSLLVFGETKQASGGAHATYSQVLEKVIWLLKDSLGIEQGNITASTTLSSIGIDSLAILEFRQQILDEFGYSLDRSAFAMSIGDLSRDIYNKLKETEAHHDEAEHKAVEEKVPEFIKEEVANVNDEAKYIKRYYTVSNPKGYAVVLPGADQKGLYFADWKLDDIQVLLVDLLGSSFNPKVTAKKVTLEMHADGYLKDHNTKIVFIGYSIGSFIALEICKELIDTYSFHPTGFIPLCYASPLACKNHLYLLPKSVRRAIMKRSFQNQLKREYGKPDPDDTIAYSVYLQRPSYATIFKWEEEAQSYFKEVIRDLKCVDGRYIRNTPIHYIYAIKDQIGNPKRISDPVKHKWGELTSGPLQISPWYGMHSSLVDPIVGSLFRERVLDVIQSMIE